MAGITDSELTAFRQTNNVTNADLIMELKYSHLESAGNSATHTKEGDPQEDLASVKENRPLEHTGDMSLDRRVADPAKGKTHTILLTRDQSQDLSANSEMVNLAGIQGAAARTGFRHAGQQLNSTARTNIESNGATNNSGTNEQMITTAAVAAEKKQQGVPDAGLGFKEEFKRKPDG